MILKLWRTSQLILTSSKQRTFRKMRMKYGLKERRQNIPIHRLADILDSGKTRTLLETHI